MLAVTFAPADDDGGDVDVDGNIIGSEVLVDILVLLHLHLLMQSTSQGTGSYLLLFNISMVHQQQGQIQGPV